MQTDDIILVWLKAPKLTWLYVRTGIEPEAQLAGKLVLTNVPDGVWIAEWLDTIENQWIRRSVERSANGKLVLETPPIQKSVAVRLLRSISASAATDARTPLRMLRVPRRFSTLRISGSSEPCAQA